MYRAATSASYIDFVRARAERNPCLRPFIRLLDAADNASCRSPTTYCIDYPQSPKEDVLIRRTSLEDGLQNVDIVAPSKTAGNGVKSTRSNTLRRIIIVEDIDTTAMQLLGARLDIDPEFFAHYVFTEIKDLATVPPPPAIGLLPSTFIRKDQVHLQYQDVLNLGSATAGSAKTYKFKVQANVERSVRCPPPVAGIQPAIVRACCSAILKSVPNGWICLILTDSATADVIPARNSPGCSTEKAFPEKYVPFQHGFEDFVDAAPFSAFASSGSESYPPKTSLVENLLWYYKQRPPALDLDNPSLLSLMYYPVRIVSSKWMLYVLLLNIYYKSHEYSVNSSRAEGVLEAGLNDLQRWRRRTKQSLGKISLITDFIKLHDPAPKEPQPSHTALSDHELSDICSLLLKDFDHIVEEIKDYRHGMDFLISISTAMFQLSVARQSIHEAINIRRLTYVALFSAPLGLVAAVFSMSADFLPGKPRFWVFIVTAVLAISAVVGMAIMTDADAQGRLRRWMNVTRRQSLWDPEGRENRGDSMSL